MTVPFRQPIREGQSGRDVLAVKLAMRDLHVQDSGAMIVRGRHRKFAGHSFVRCLKHVQHNHHLHMDGVYGPMMHEVFAPHFTAYERWLYRTAPVRHHEQPPVPGSAVAAAKELLVLNGHGYTDNRGGSELAQIERTARGDAVWSPRGLYVHLDERILQILVWLIQDKGFKIGTFAMCTDHGADTPLGHSGGHAVDIDSIDGSFVTSGSPTTKKKVVAVLDAIREAPAHLRPWQLISGGYGEHLDAACEARCIPNAAEFGGETLLAHTNHIHVGYE